MKNNVVELQKKIHDVIIVESEDSDIKFIDIIDILDIEKNHFLVSFMESTSREMMELKKKLKK